MAALLLASPTPMPAQFLPPGVVNWYADDDVGDDTSAAHLIGADGTMYVVWASTNPYAVPTGFDRDIYYSENDGSGWTFPEIVNPWAAGDSAVDDRPRLALTPDGAVHVVWESRYDDGATGTDWDVFHRALDPVTGWGAVEPVNADAATDNLSLGPDDTAPNLVARPDGSVVVVYQAQAASGTPALAWRVWTGSGWSAGGALGNNGVGPAALALTEDGGVAAAWEAALNWTANHIIAAAVLQPVGVWSTFVELTEGSVNSIHPVVATMGSGLRREIHYVWASNDSAGGVGGDYDLKHFVRLEQAPYSYGPFTVNRNAASDGSADDLWPSLCIEPGGVLHVAWQSPVDLLSGTDLDVYHAENGSPGGEWGPVGFLGLNAPFDGPGEDDTEPEIVCGRSHVLSGLWTSTDDLGGTVGSDRDLFNALGVGRLYHRPRPATPWAAGAASYDGRARVAVAGGTVHVVWESTSTGGALSTGTDADLYHVSFVDGTLGEPDLVNTSGEIDSGDDHAPDLAVDAQGRLHVVWSSTSDIGGSVGTDADIFYAVRGAAGWSAPELVHASGAGDSIDDLHPRIAVDGVGGVHVLWYQDLSPTSGRLAYARRTAAGWSATEIPTVPTALDWSPGSYDLAVTLGGEPHVIWTSSADHAGAGSDDTDVFWSHRSAGVWSTAELVNDYGVGDGDADETPALACAPDGEVYAVWASMHDTGSVGSDWDLFIAKRDPPGERGVAAFQPAFPLLTRFLTDTGDDLAPDLTVGVDTIDVAWESDDPLAFGTAGTDLDILHARVPRTSGLPADIAVGVVNPNAFGDGGDDAGVAMAVVAGGSVFFAWQSVDSLGIGLGSDDDVLLGRLYEIEVLFNDGFEYGSVLPWSSAQP